MATFVGSALTKSKTDFGRILRYARLQLGLSQTLLAYKTGISQTNISSLEIGNNSGKFLPSSKIVALADALQIPRKRLRKLAYGSNTKSFASQLVRSTRLALGLSMENLAQEVGCSARKVSHVEAGIGKIRVEEISKWAKALYLNAEELESLRLKPNHSGLTKTNSPLGAKIRKARIENGLYQDDLANKLGVTRAYISSIELGESNLQRSSILERIAHVLELDLEELQALVPKTPQ